MHFKDTEECDSSLEHVTGIPKIITCGSQNNSLEHVVPTAAGAAGTCPTVAIVSRPE